MSKHGVRHPDNAVARGATMTTGLSSIAACLVQSLGVDDMEDILTIERASFTTPWTPAMFEAEFQGNPFCRFLGAVLPGGGTQGADLLGYVCYWMVFDELRLMNVAVRPTHRRRGIARHLVQRALRDGHAHGTTRALLEVRASNGAACALYQALGFAPYGRRRAYYTQPDEDALLMHLTAQGGGGTSRERVPVSTTGGSSC